MNLDAVRSGVETRLLKHHGTGPSLNSAKMTRRHRPGARKSAGIKPPSVTIGSLSSVRLQPRNGIDWNEAWGGR